MPGRKKRNGTRLKLRKKGLFTTPITYYCGKTTTSIKRVPPLPPRKIYHHWLLDAITGRPFMLSDTPESKTSPIEDPAKVLDPVIDLQGAAENIKEHLPRFIMRHYKYFFTPTIETNDFTLFYIKVWLFNFTDKNNTEMYLGINSWSGNIMEVED